VNEGGEPLGRDIKAVVMDVDGVLTDGGVWWGPDGAEWKRFCFADIMGVSRGKAAGLIFGLVSGEDSPMVDRFAAKFGLEDVHKGCKDKASAVRQIAERRGLALEQVCFVGDDINDIEAMTIAGLSAAPADAQPAALAAAKVRLTRRGGHGAVRELIESLVGPL
jgi:3-deoxy-D-manno-octulosonate 8-phosphate phosphatase (KDO 8-P phosphatase)